jgi:homoserine dehydrogenase
LEEYFNNDLLTSVSGIVNGSTNYILTQMTKNNLDYQTALTQAQEQGFAESNPALDVEGLDARNKLKIIALHAFGKVIDEQHITVQGVTSISPFDIAYAKEKGYVIKLIANCKVNPEGEIQEASVLPTFIPKYHPLRLTDNEFNGVLIGGQLADEQFLYGKGAGRYPTSSAVLSDISAYTYNYKYAYKKRITPVNKVQVKTKKFYLSFVKNQTIDFSAYGEVQEVYETPNQCYVTLWSKATNVLELAHKHDLSVISYS